MRKLAWTIDGSASPLRTARTPAASGSWRGFGPPDRGPTCKPRASGVESPSSWPLNGVREGRLDPHDFTSVTGRSSVIAFGSHKSLLHYVIYELYFMP